ncbi:hypothetical protein BASA61_003296 [Batrachochytrium salamandrivorans]|nr:hypothetical protein BASA61_003296 [Batrachochytrium salamandrivorans]
MAQDETTPPLSAPYLLYADLSLCSSAGTTTTYRLDYTISLNILPSDTANFLVPFLQFILLVRSLLMKKLFPPTLSNDDADMPCRCRNPKHISI